MLSSCVKFLIGLFGFEWLDILYMHVAEWSKTDFLIFCIDVDWFKS